ncbi:MAG: hypothetical protein JWM43_1206 [Acidobacteriaceae bacterium]|nr:hypothetical protein [Acidobacteriaceae bacterium]
MTAMLELEEIVEGTVGALARLEVDELEALERRLLMIVRAEGMQGVDGRRLRSKLELLGRCVAMTAGNLRMLEGLAERGVVAE